MTIAVEQTLAAPISSADEVSTATVEVTDADRSKAQEAVAKMLTVNPQDAAAVS